MIILRRMTTARSHLSALLITAASFYIETISPFSPVLFSIVSHVLSAAFRWFRIYLFFILFFQISLLLDYFIQVFLIFIYYHFIFCNFLFLHNIISRKFRIFSIWIVLFYNVLYMILRLFFKQIAWYLFFSIFFYFTLSYFC